LFKANIIRDYDGKEYSYDEFICEIKKLERSGYKMFIGSDSQVIKEEVCLVACVCPYKEQKGGRVFYVKKKFSKKKFPTTRMRLLFEAYKSIEVAMEIDSSILGPLEIHLDVGSDLIRCKSSRWKKEIETLVSSQGYDCKVKPDSWASSVADRFTKR
jgi:predicted RNase H-related nuclease YkuK (DUF458 family)